MATSDSGLSDEIAVILNPDPDEPAPAPATDPVPDRPDDGASKSSWRDYAIALGADVGVSMDTEHWDPAAGQYVTEKALSREQLIELADRIGG